MNQYAALLRLCSNPINGFTCAPRGYFVLLTNTACLHNDSAGVFDHKPSCVIDKTRAEVLQRSNAFHMVAPGSFGFLRDWSWIVKCWCRHC